MCFRSIRGSLYLKTQTMVDCPTHCMFQMGDTGAILPIDDGTAQSINLTENNLSITVSGGYVPSISNGFLYTNQYGQIGTHNPEEFFTRLFQNKYEQAPSPVQIARGVEMLGGSTVSLDLNALSFLHSVLAGLFGKLALIPDHECGGS